MGSPKGQTGMDQKSLTSYLVTLPTGEAFTVEADTEENARAAAAAWLEVDGLPTGALVIHADAQP